MWLFNCCTRWNGYDRLGQQKFFWNLGGNVHGQCLHIVEVRVTLTFKIDINSLLVGFIVVIKQIVVFSCLIWDGRLEDLFGAFQRVKYSPMWSNNKMRRWQLGSVDVVMWTWQLCKDGLCNFPTLNLWLVGKLTKLPCGHIDLAKGPSETNQKILFPT
jgi:hypothetical protein